MAVPGPCDHLRQRLGRTRGGIWKSSSRGNEMKSLDAGRWVTLLLAFALAEGAYHGISAQTLIPLRMGTAQVPLSTIGSIALMSDESTACVIDSYEVRVRCVDRSGDVVGVLGREGEGPGEFGSASALVGGSDNTVGVVDNWLGRFSVFEPSGVLVTEVALAGVVQSVTPLRRFSTTLVGRTMVDGLTPVMFEFDMASREVEMKDVPAVDAEVECGEIIYGFPNPGGGWVHVACEGHLVFVAENGDVAVLQAPTYTGELPNRRDVEWWEEVARSTEQRDLPFEVDWDARIAEIRSTPKNYHLVFGQQKFDERGRLWIATQRDRDEFSYLDVYDPAEAAFVGSVRVSDRIEGFDLLGSTLVVVVERQLSPDDPAGISDRAVDWYDIGDLGFGR